MVGREMSPTMRLYFNYVPIGIITAIIIKQILVPVEGQLTLSIPLLIGCIATALVIKKTKMFLFSIVVGVVVGLAVRYVLG
jgi:branched-subunit amino acid transport protein